MCQPDGLLFLTDKDGKLNLVIIEIKLAHCFDAYFQLYELYLPVVDFYYKNNHGGLSNIYCLEVVKFYDSTLPMPRRPVLSPEETRLVLNEFCVKIWTP